MTNQRTIIIGDVHGCFDELQELLKLLKATRNDRLISVGDLICKGPASSKTLDWAMLAENLTCVMGNHELRFLECWKQNIIPDIKPYDLETCLDLKPNYEKYMQFISTWPFYVDSLQFLVVHAGLRPGVSLDSQSKEDLTEIRTLDDKGNQPWYDSYKSESKKIIVFGHWVRREALNLKNLIGLDTGCVYGGKLSALVLPERKIVSVKAKKVYRDRLGPWA